MFIKTIQNIIFITLSSIIITVQTNDECSLNIPNSINKCSSLCCNIDQFCAQGLNQCSEYSENHCLNLGCNTCKVQFEEVDDQDQQSNDKQDQKKKKLKYKHICLPYQDNPFYQELILCYILIGLTAICIFYNKIMNNLRQQQIKQSI